MVRRSLPGVVPASPCKYQQCPLFFNFSDLGQHVIWSPWAEEPWERERRKMEDKRRVVCWNRVLGTEGVSPGWVEG